jgi:hypothetical protein
VTERRAQIERQRREFMREMAADETTTGWAATLETGPETPGDGVQEHGDRATVVDSCRVSWRPPFTQRPRGAGPVWYNGEPYQWRAEVRRDGGGWRLRSVVLPAWCGTYSRCSSAPAATPSTTASAMSDDPLGNAKSMLPCGTRDPYPWLHDCPSPLPTRS